MAIRVRGGAALMLAGFITISCGGVTDPSKNNVESFQGTVNPGGLPWLRDVAVNNTGEYSVKITALSPTPTAVLFVGWYQGAGCQIQMFTNIASLNRTALSGAVFQKGTYCVLVSDPGTLTAAQNFTIEVSHP
jgi:hypothetical protein